MAFKQIVLLTSVLFFGFSPSVVGAHQPVIEPSVESSYSESGLFFKAIRLGDPTKQSLANYGNISKPGEVDAYVFSPEQSAEIPVELLVTIRPANSKFKPDLYVVAKSLPDAGLVSEGLPFEIPEGYKAIKISNQHDDGIFYEPFSFERYWRGEEIKLSVEPKQNYFLVIAEPNKQTGDYSLGVGTVENFSDASFFEVLQNVFLIKMGAVGNVVLPALDFIGLFIFIAGFVVGLGAVTVIDVMGFLGRTSKYWTESTIRAHKVTKPLIWAGLFLLIVGAVITYRDSWLTGVALFQLICILILILNGLFLTFYVSPKLLRREKDGEIAEILPIALRNKITVSFAISFIGWWTTLFLFVWYIVVMR